MDAINVNPVRMKLEDIRQTTEEGVEFWSARELYPLLGYVTWEAFAEVIRRAKESCENSGEQVKNHFRDATKMVTIGSDASRPLIDIHFTRYACYLAAQNGDPRKPEIAAAQTYFAQQTRKQEVFENLSEEQKRLFIRKEVTDSNKKLFSTAKAAGVKLFGRFNNAGYMGLYGDLTIAQIERRKRIPKGKLLDKAGTTELAANLFRITQTEDKLQKDNIQGQLAAENIHRKVGREVRSTIANIGGRMPENLPAEEDIKVLAQRFKKKKVLTQKSADENPMDIKSSFGKE